ncbi:MAG: ABC transporter ATP-binding protein [Rhodospirillaceae bacterium]|nr:ABC transporter ATP-binding protein [Rhodospirillaceae bacterium]
MSSLGKFRAALSSAYRIYRWSFSNYMRAERRRLILNFGCLTVSSLTMAVLAWLVAPAIDELTESDYGFFIYLIPIGVLMLVTVNGFALYASQILTETINQNTIAALQRDIYRHFLSLNLKAAAEMPTGTMIAFATNEASRAISNLTTLLIGLSRDMLSFAFLLAVMLLRDWQLSLFVVISFPPLIAAVAMTSRRVRHATGEAMEAGFRLTQLTTNVLTSLRLVKIFDAVAFESERQGRAVDARRDTTIELTRRKAVMTPINEIAGGLAIAAVLTFAIVRAEIIGEFRFGDIASFLTAVFLAYRPLKKMTNAIPQFVSGLYTAERIRDLNKMATEPRDGDLPDDGKCFDGSVEVDDVTFSYVPGQPVLRGVSLTLPKGRTVALVGPSGSGKTTLINLIPRLYPLDAGRIVIDGVEVTAAPLAKLRRSIALVSQETLLLDDTVLRNIAYGAAEPDRARAEACLREANAWSFVSDLPDGLDSRIGEKGELLSGGQRQRIALARALYRDAPVLLLDEPTSALDGESEREVREAIRRIAHDRSILIVAHRLPAIQFADYVYVLVDGRIVEEGTHAELSAADGVYAKIFHIQQLEDQFGRQLTA